MCDVNASQLPLVIAALNHPHRLRVVRALREERKYVSALARELGVSRPLLYLHLERLEAAGLVTSSLELGESGKAVKWYELAAFDIRLTPAAVAAAADRVDVANREDDRGERPPSSPGKDAKG